MTDHDNTLPCSESLAVYNPCISLDRAKKKKVGWLVNFGERGAPTWKRFLELPGLLRSLFSPTFLVPSLMLDELEVKGSGAATFESFWGMVNGGVVAGRGGLADSHFLQTISEREQDT